MINPKLSQSKYLILKEILQAIQIQIVYIFMKGQIPRSQQFIYQQNKAIHYNRLKNIHSTINNQSKAYRYQVDSDGYTHDSKYRNNLKRQQLIENKKMTERILEIIKSPRTEVAVQGGFSKQEQSKYEFRKIKKVKIEQDWELQMNNSNLIDRINQAKPIIGSRKQWEKNFQKFQQDASHMSRFYSERGKKSRGELNHSSNHKSSILNQNELKQIRSSKKQSLKYDRLLILPEIKSKNQNGLGNQTIDVTQTIEKQLIDKK